MKGLIGREHKSLVNHLELRLDDIVEGKEVPRVVILEAPSGSGKSRIIRELYERLRTNPEYRNETPIGECYWPALESDVYIEDGLHSGFQHRKELGPSHTSFFRPPHALPGFMWQTIRCDLLAGKVSGSVLEIISPQIQAHFPYVAHALHSHKSAKEKAHSAVSRIFNLDEWENIKDASIGEGILKVFEKLEILQGVPFVSWGIDRGIEAFRLSREQISRRKDVANGGDLGTALASAQSIYRNLLSGVHKKIPLILAIEDIHLIDDEIAALIAGFAAHIKDKPVLVVGTAWPESKSRDSYVALLESLGCEGGIGNERIEIIAEGSPTRKFPQLTPKENSRFVSFYAPKTNISTAIEIASLFENPFAIKLSMSSRLVQGHISNQALNLRKSDLVKLPKTVEDIYRARWKEIAAPVREVLLSATATFPQNSLSSGELHFFISDVLVEALSKWNHSKHEKKATEEALARATDPLRWIKQVESTSPFTFQFKEWILQRVVHDELSQEWPASDIAEFRQVTVDVLQNKILKPFEGKSKDAERFFDVADSLGRRFSRYFLGLIEGQKDIKFSKEAEQISRLSLGYAAWKERKTQESINQLRKVNFNSKTLVNDFMWNLKYEYDVIITDLWPSPIHLKQLKKTVENLVNFYGTEKWPFIGYQNLIGMTELQLRLPRQALQTWKNLRTSVTRECGTNHKLYFQLIGNTMQAHVAMGDFRSAKQNLKQLFAIKGRSPDLFKNYEATLLQWDWILNGRPTSFAMAVEALKEKVKRIEEFEGPNSSEALMAKNDLLVFNQKNSQDSADVRELRELIDIATQNNKQDKQYYGHLLLHNYSMALEKSLRDGSIDQSQPIEFEVVSAQAFKFALDHQNRYTVNFANSLTTRIDQLVYLKNFRLAEKYLRLEHELISTADNNGRSELDYLLHFSYVLGCKALSVADPDEMLREALSICEAIYPRVAQDRRLAKLVLQNMISYSDKLGDKESLVKWYALAINLTVPQIEVNDYFTNVYQKIAILCERSLYKQAKREIQSSFTTAASLYPENKVEVFDWYQASIDTLLSINEFLAAYEVAVQMRQLLENGDSKAFGPVRVANGWNRIYEAASEFGDGGAARLAVEQVVRTIKGAKGYFSRLDILHAKFLDLSSRTGTQKPSALRNQFRLMLKELSESSASDLWWPETVKFHAAIAEDTHSTRMAALQKLGPFNSASALTKEYFEDLKTVFVANELHVSGFTSEAIIYLTQRVDNEAVTAEGSIELLLAIGFLHGINGAAAEGLKALKAAKEKITSYKRPNSKSEWELKIYLAFIDTQAGRVELGLDKLVRLRKQVEAKFQKDSWLVMLTFESEFLCYAKSGKLQKARKVLNQMHQRFDENVLSRSNIAALETYLAR